MLLNCRLVIMCNGTYIFHSLLVRIHLVIFMHSLFVIHPLFMEYIYRLSNWIKMVQVWVTIR